MKTPLFVFLGVVESCTDANIGILKNLLEAALSKFLQQIKIDEKPDLIIIKNLQLHFGAT
jgi:hypothetical protein